MVLDEMSILLFDFWTNFVKFIQLDRCNYCNRTFYNTQINLFAYGSYETRITYEN